MPTPAMHKTAQEQMQPPAVQAANAGDLPRFPSPSHGPIGPRYEPGVVEAQFRIGLMPRVIPGGPGQAPSLVAGAQSPEAGVPLNDVNDLLRRYQAVSAEPTFTFTVEEGGLPYLSDFVTLHFPAEPAERCRACSAAAGRTAAGRAGGRAAAASRVSARSVRPAGRQRLAMQFMIRKVIACAHAQLALV
jgi:hypothetical protein